MSNVVICLTLFKCKSITSVGEESVKLFFLLSITHIFYFAFRRGFSFSRCSGKVALLYCGTPWVSESVIMRSEQQIKCIIQMQNWRARFVT